MTMSNSTRSSRARLYRLGLCVVAGLVWFDTLGHLTNVIQLGFQVGGPYPYGTPNYELFWTIYWGFVGVIVTYMFVYEFVLSE